MKRNQPFAHLFTIVFICLFVAGINSSNAQTAPITRVAVAIENNQTRIWLSDFPKKTTVVLFDDNNNLLTVISTN